MSENTGRKSGAVRRQERAIREKQEKKKVRVTAVVIVAVLAVLFCGAMLINSDYIRRSAVAVSSGDLKFTAAEFDYFYSTAYSEYATMVYQSVPEYADQFLPDTSKPFASQIYEASTGKTWKEYLEELAFERISQVSAIYAEAQKAGFVMSDETRQTMENDLESLRAEAEQYGYVSLTKYLQAMYGSTSLNEKTMIKLSEVMYTVNAYNEHVVKSFSYTEDELESYYQENKDKYDLFTYRYFHVKMEDIGVESDYESTEAFDNAKADAIAAALAQGQEIANGIKSEQDFINAAREYDEETYELDDSTLRHYSGDMLGETQGPWLREAERAEGDVTAIEFSNGCYVQMYISRSQNEYNLVNMRVLLLAPETVSPDSYPEGVDDAAYGAAVAKSLEDIWDEADLIMNALEQEGATEEKFLEMIELYSDSTVEGGLHENVHMYQTDGALTAEANAWPFEEGREVGDYGLVSSTDGNLYILYLSSHGEIYKEHLANEGMKTRDYNAWDEAIGRPEIKTHWAFALVG